MSHLYDLGFNGSVLNLVLVLERMLGIVKKEKDKEILFEISTNSKLCELVTNPLVLLFESTAIRVSIIITLNHLIVFLFWYTLCRNCAIYCYSPYTARLRV